MDEVCGKPEGSFVNFLRIQQQTQREEEQERKERIYRWLKAKRQRLLES